MKLKLTRKHLIGVVIGLTALLSVWWFLVRSSEASAEDFMTARIERGDIRNNVFATGTLQAVTTVQVGSQVSGTISSLSADFNTQVRKGQVVAQLDPSILQAQVASARANLEQARAGLADAQARVLAAKSTIQNQQAGVSGANANLAALKAQLDDAASLLKRQEALAAGGIVPERDLETARTSYRAAEARYTQAVTQVQQARTSEQASATSGLAQAEAQVKQSQAQNRQAEASLKLAEVNLSHTTITSPIDGVVVSRNVDVGQTVAASLSAPTLFTIANDLTQMQVIANIDQADIGAINQDNHVTFTVDAFTGRKFEGTIKEIRLNPQNVQNVVTYNVVINVHNPDLKLMPGMTTNLTFAVAERKGVLKLPNAALRFTPKDVTPEKIRELLRARNGSEGLQIPPDTETKAAPGNQPASKADDNQRQRRQQTASGEAGSRASTGEAAQRQGGGGSGQDGPWRIVWVLGPDHKPQPRRVRTGITDGSVTEIRDGDLQEGEMIIVGQKISGNGATATGSQRPPGFGGQPGGGFGGRR